MAAKRGDSIGWMILDVLGCVLLIFAGIMAGYAIYAYRLDNKGPFEHLLPDLAWVCCAALASLGVPALAISRAQRRRALSGDEKEGRNA